MIYNRSTTLQASRASLDRSERNVIVAAVRPSQSARGIAKLSKSHWEVVQKLTSTDDRRDPSSPCTSVRMSNPQSRRMIVGGATDVAAFARFEGRYHKSAGFQRYQQKLHDETSARRADVSVPQLHDAFKIAGPAAATMTSFQEFNDFRKRNVPPKYGEWSSLVHGFSIARLLYASPE